MKRSIQVLIALFGLLTNMTLGQNLQLKQTIDSLHSIDQHVQLALKAAFENKMPFDSIRKLEEVQNATFIRHTPVVKNIYERHGYPTEKLVGKETSSRFFTLIQHSDNDVKFQSSMLPILKKLSDKGEISSKGYAYLYDRVQRNTGGLQLYGTQLSYGNKGNLFDDSDKLIYPKDLADPPNVDKRRKEVGLSSLEDYYEEVLRQLGRPRRK